MQFTQQQKEEFFACLSRHIKSDKEYFYKIFKIFANQHQIQFANNYDEANEEQHLYSEALKLGLVGYKVISVIEESNKIQEFFQKYYERTEELYFLFSYQIEDEEGLSLCKIYEKWHDLPPKGWFGKYCDCGKFFPISLEIAEMDATLNETYNFFDDSLRPCEIEIDDICSLAICSDNILRFNMRNNRIICCKALKMDMGVNLAFTDIGNLI